VRYSRYVWALGCFLPAIPFIHAGFELGETVPVNTGLGFSPEELALYGAERLALFSACALDWTSGGSLEAWIARVLAVRGEHAELVTDPSPATFRLLDAGNRHLLAFERHAGGKALLVVANASMGSSEPFRLALPKTVKEAHDLLAGRRLRVGEGHLDDVMDPGEVIVLRCEMVRGA
jgi:hypothetical protein